MKLSCRQYFLKRNSSLIAWKPPSPIAVTGANSSIRTASQVGQLFNDFELQEARARPLTSAPSLSKAKITAYDNFLQANGRFVKPSLEHSEFCKTTALNWGLLRRGQFDIPLKITETRHRNCQSVTKDATKKMNSIGDSFSGATTTPIENSVMLENYLNCRRTRNLLRRNRNTAQDNFTGFKAKQNSRRVFKNRNHNESHHITE